MARSIWFSLTDASTDHLNEGQFIGFANYFSWIKLDSGQTVYTGVLVDPEWWNAVWNTLRFAFISVILETVARLGRGAGAERQLPGPRHSPRRDPGALGDPDHRLGEDVVAGCSMTSSASSTTCC